MTALGSQGGNWVDSGWGWWLKGPSRRSEKHEETVNGKWSFQEPGCHGVSAGGGKTQNIKLLCRLI